MSEKSKFKNVLNELSSPQRTALLYLEKQIIEKNNEALKLINESKSPTINLDPMSNKINSLEQKISGFVNKYSNKIKYVDKLTEKNSKIVEDLDHILSAHIRDINCASDMTNKLLDKVLDLIAFSYHKDQNIGPLESQGKVGAPILTGENKIGYDIKDVSELITSILHIKEIIKNSPYRLKPTSVDTSEKRSPE